VLPAGVFRELLAVLGTLLLLVAWGWLLFWLIWPLLLLSPLVQAVDLSLHLLQVRVVLIPTPHPPPVQLIFQIPLLLLHELPSDRILQGRCCRLLGGSSITYAAAQVQPPEV
jgi:hypothetical protein